MKITVTDDSIDIEVHRGFVYDIPMDRMRTPEAVKSCRTKKSCRNCMNFVTKVPVVNGKLCYCQATARCKAGALWRLGVGIPVRK